MFAENLLGAEHPFKKAVKLLNLVLVIRLHHGGPEVSHTGRATVSLLPLSLCVWTSLRSVSNPKRCLLVKNVVVCSLTYYNTDCQSLMLPLILHSSILKAKAYGIAGSWTVWERFLAVGSAVFMQCTSGKV